MNSMPQTIGEHSRLPQVTSGDRFVQREMPYLSAMPAPIDAPREAIALCRSAQDALNASLAKKRFSQRKYAGLLGVSHVMVGYMQRGERPIPERLVDRICVVTGTNLLRQWLRFQKALRSIESGQTECEYVERIAREIRVA